MSAPMDADDVGTCAPFALSPRRAEILRLLARGLTNDEIASALTISSGTVRSHVTAVLQQLDVTNRTEAAARYVAWESRPAQVATVLQRPAIAVLPIAALDESPRTRTVAAGLTEDLATLFARWCWFPVIATSSSANARSLGKTAQEIGKQLGARFLLEGAVRRARHGWRLSVHIDDAESAHRIWSEHYDVPAEQLGEIEDEVCQTIVAAVYPMLIARTRTCVPMGRPTTELAAWELAHDGMALRAIRAPEANLAARRRFDEALERDPDLTLAHFGVGLACYDAVLNQWGEKEPLLDLFVTSAQRCTDLSPHAAEGYYLLGRYLQTRGEWARAVAPLEAAIGRNPSFALAHASLSQSLQACGRGEEGVVRMEHAVRLGPQSFVVGLATLHFMRGEYTDAAEQAERAIVTNPGYPFAHVLAAASAFWLGDARRGRAHLETLRVRHPGFSPANFASTFGEQVDAVGRVRRALDALSGAG